MVEAPNLNNYDNHHGDGPKANDDEEEIQQRQQAVMNLVGTGMAAGSARNNLNQGGPPLSVAEGSHRMQLSSQHHQLALQIKDTLENCPDINPTPSDFCCAQMALLQEGDDVDVDISVERSEQLQAFRETYRIIDDWQFGCQCMQELHQVCPDFILSLTFNPRTGGYVLVTDLEKFDLKAILSHADGIAVVLRAVYFIAQMFCCDLEAVRMGAIIMHEADGHTPRKGFNLKFFRRLVTELGTPYPILLSRVLFFHSGLFINLLVSMVRPFAPKRNRKKLVIGCKSEKRLDKIFNTPNPQMAQQHRMKQYQKLLKRRYHHEKTFHL